MLYILLTMIRLVFKVLFLPVRAALHIVAFVMKILLTIGSVATTLLGGICVLSVIVDLLFYGHSVTDAAVWPTIVIGILCFAIPYIGAVLIAVPLTVAELLKRFTSPHPFQDLDLEGGKYHEA